MWIIQFSYYCFPQIKESYFFSNYEHQYGGFTVEYDDPWSMIEDWGMED